MGEAQNKQAISSFHDLERYFKGGWENHLFAGAVFVDKQGVIQFLNNQVSVILGYTAEELRGKNLFSLTELLAAADIALMKKRFKANLEQEKLSTPQQYTLIKKDGQRVYVDVKSVPVTDGKKVIGILVVLLDVTYRQELIETITEAKQRHSIIAKETGQLLYDYTIDTGAIEWFGDVQGVTGYSVKYFNTDMNIDGWIERVHPDDRRVSLELLRRAQRPGDRFDAEYRFKIKGGRYIWVQENGIVIAKDDALHMYGVMKDNTRQKEILEEYKKLSDNYEAIYQAINDAIFIVDFRDGSVLDVNDKAEEMLGYTKNELRGMQIGDFSVTEEGFTQKEAVSRITKALRKGSRFEWKHKHKNGTPIWVEVSLRKAQLGEQAVVLAVLRDISDLVEYREHMKEHASELESLNRVMVGREVKMIELKERIKQLEHQLHDAQGE